MGKGQLLKSSKLLATLALVMAFTGACATAGQEKIPTAPSQSETIQITALADSYELTGPVSRLVMTIPKLDFSPTKNPFGGATKSPRYFFFVDSVRQLRISGWFEPERLFPGAKKSWEDAAQQRKLVGLPEPQDVSFVRIGKWEAIAYETRTPAVSNSDIQAHLVQGGTWIHLHISTTSSDESRAKLVAFLQTIHVKEKTAAFSRPPLLALLNTPEHRGCSITSACPFGSSGHRGIRAETLSTPISR